MNRKVVREQALSGRGTVACSAIVLFVLLMALAMGFLVFASRITGVALPINVEVDRDAILQGALLYLASLVVASITPIVVTVLVALVATHSVVYFLDSRWLPGVREKGPIRELGGQEVYETKPGEQFEKLDQPNWLVIHVKETLSYVLRVLARGIALNFGLSFTVLATALALPLFGLALPHTVALVYLTYLASMCYVAGAILAKYWVNEWKRQNTIWVMFTFSFHYLEGGTSVTGLFSGKSADVLHRSTPASVAGEMTIVTDPSRDDPSYPTSWLWNEFLDLMGSIRGVRCINVLSYFNKAEDKLHFFSWANGITRANEALRAQAKEFAFEDEKLHEDATGIEHGNPNDTTWTPEKGRQARENFIKSRTAHLRSPDVINLFSLKGKPQRFDRNGRPINRGAFEEKDKGKSKVVEVASHFGVSTPQAPSPNKPESPQKQKPRNDRLPNP